MRQGPLAGRYAAVAAMVMFALIPYLALSSALEPLTPIIGEQLNMSMQTLSLGSGLANAAYAVGTVLAVQFAQHLPQRRMLVGYAVLLVIGSILAAGAQDAGMYIAGRVIQGLCTSLLLIAAVPPLSLGFPPQQAAHHRDDHEHVHLWAPSRSGRPSAACRPRRTPGGRSSGSSPPSLCGPGAGGADLRGRAARRPRLAGDLPALSLAAAGCVAAFFGASLLTSHSFLDPR